MILIILGFAVVAVGVGFTLYKKYHKSKSESISPEDQESAVKLNNNESV